MKFKGCATLIFVLLYVVQSCYSDDEATKEVKKPRKVFKKVIKRRMYAAGQPIQVEGKFPGVFEPFTGIATDIEKEASSVGQVPTKPPIKTITIHKEVKVPVPRSVPYPIEKKVMYPIQVPVPVFITQLYPVHVPKPYPVPVEKPVPYPVIRKVPYPIKVPYKVPVPHPYPKPIPKPVPYPVDEAFTHIVKIPLDVEKASHMEMMQQPQWQSSAPEYAAWQLNGI